MSGDDSLGHGFAGHDHMNRAVSCSRARGGVNAGPSERAPFDVKSQLDRGVCRTLRMASPNDSKIRLLSDEQAHALTEAIAACEASPDAESSVDALLTRVGAILRAEALVFRRRGDVWSDISRQAASRVDCRSRTVIRPHAASRSCHGPTDRQRRVDGRARRRCGSAPRAGDSRRLDLCRESAGRHRAPRPGQARSRGRGARRCAGRRGFCIG